MGLFGKSKKKLIEKNTENFIESNELEKEIVDYSNEIDDSFDVVNLFGNEELNESKADISINKEPENISDMDIYEYEKIENPLEIKEDFDISTLFESDNTENNDSSVFEEEEEISYISEEPILNNTIVNEKQKIVQQNPILGKKSLFEKKKSLNLNKKDILQKMEQPKEEEIKVIEEKINKSTFVSIDENYIAKPKKNIETNVQEPINQPIEEHINNEIKDDLEELKSFNDLFELNKNESYEQKPLEEPESINDNLDKIPSNTNVEVQVIEDFENDENIQQLNIEENIVEKGAETQEDDVFDALFDLFDSIQENKQNEILNNEQNNIESSDKINLQEELINSIKEDVQKSSSEVVLSQKRDEYEVDIVEYEEDLNIATNFEEDIFEESNTSILGDILGKFKSKDQENNLESKINKQDLEINEDNSIVSYELDEEEIKRQEELLDMKLIEEIKNTVSDNETYSNVEINELLETNEEEETLEDLINSQESQKLDKTLDNFEKESNNYLKEKRKGLLKNDSLTKNLKKFVKEEPIKAIEPEENIIDKATFISIDEAIDESLFKEKQIDYSRLNEHFNPYIGKSSEEIEELRKQSLESLEKNNLDIEKELHSIINEDLEKGIENLVTEENYTQDNSLAGVDGNIIENNLIVNFDDNELKLKKQKEELARLQQEEALKNILAELQVIKEDIETIDFSIFQEFANFIYSYRKLRKEYLDNKKKKEELRKKAEAEKREREKEMLLAQKQALLEEQLMRQGYGTNVPSLIGNVSENSRDKLMRLRQTSKEIPDEEETIYGVKVNNRDILLSELNAKLPRKALYDEYIDDSYEDTKEEYVSPNKNTFANQSMRPPDKRGTLKNRGFEDGYRREDDFK